MTAHQKRCNEILHRPETYCRAITTKGHDAHGKHLLLQGPERAQFGILLFLAAGLTLVFGIMDFINLAHGVLYMVGAYLMASLSATAASGEGCC